MIPSAASLSRISAVASGLVRFPFHLAAQKSRYRSFSHRQSTRMDSSSAQAPTDFGSFKLLQDFPVSYAPVRISKWRSDKTGLTVVLGHHDAPVTNGHFAIASEIFDDTGRPHTLEHLIFLGSKSYPYKGVLDQLANRAGSDGTNAWTANDHTAYTIATAGTDGFLKMLPIYVDHILHPTITDAGFVTEVHHINGQGEDAGVVYSEMQARENQAGDLMALRMQRMLYPESSAYRSETGGLMSMLRVLTAQQIRDYHGEYYVPHNLCLLIDGAINLPDLFAVLNEQVDPLIIKQREARGDAKAELAGWKRPFVETSTAKPLAIAAPETQVVEFMEEDESMGDVSMVWLGPPPMDYRQGLALKVLNDYLTYSATSPLQKEFVEVPKPFCSGIGFYSEDRVNKNEISCSMSDVPYKHLESMSGRVFDALRRIKDKDGIDMERMHRILRRDRRKLLNSMETSVSSILSDVVIGDFLYGDADGKDLPAAFTDMVDYEVIEGYTADEWLALLDKIYLSQPALTVIGKPSAALSAKLEKEEKERLDKRRAELGEEKLKELEKAVEEAKKESEIPPPESMIADFPLTDPKNLTWVPVETGINNAASQSIGGDNGAVQRHIEADGQALPFQAHYAHVKSHFVTISALFDTIRVPAHLKPYFTILSSAFFASGVKLTDGRTLSHEEVIDQLNDFTISQSAFFTFRYLFSEVFTIEIKVETSEYERAVGWIRDVVAGSTFTKERLQVIVAKLMQELPYEKRDGDKVASAWLNRLAYDAEKSTSEACGLLAMLEFVPQVAKDLEENPDDIIQKLEEARAYLLDPDIVRVSVRGDILGLKEPRSALSRAFLPIKEAAPLAPLSLSSQTKTDLGKNPAKKMVLIPMPAIEGSYSVHMAKGISGFDHPDSAVLTLAVTLLNAAESYLWRSVRGAGLAYGASIETSLESGVVMYSVYRSPNATLAYLEAKKILTGLADGSIELDQKIVNGARASLTYRYARASETVGAAASTAYLNEVLKGVGKDYNQKLLEAFPSVTLEQIRSAIQKYLLPIFDASTAIGAVSVSSGKADEVEKGFRDMGFEVERHELPQLGEDGSEDGSDVEMSGSESGSDSGSDSGDGMEDVKSP